MKKLALCFLIPFAAFAQDVRVNGGSAFTEIFRSTNTNPAATNRIAVRGISTPVPSFGTGVRGDGGSIGVMGLGVLAGPGSRYGVQGFGQNGTIGNYGVSGIADATNGSNKYGVYGAASGEAGVKYGVYGAAVGAGTNFGVFCNGNGAYTGTWLKVSDFRTKKNIQEYSGALDKVMAIGVKKYDFNQAAYPSVNLKSKAEVGIIAQDMEKVFPDIVSDIVAPAGVGAGQSGPEGKVTLKGVDYVALVPILLQAIKEQQVQINALKKKVGG